MTNTEIINNFITNQPRFENNNNENENFYYNNDNNLNHINNINDNIYNNNDNIYEVAQMLNWFNNEIDNRDNFNIERQEIRRSNQAINNRIVQNFSQRQTRSRIIRRDSSIRNDSQTYQQPSIRDYFYNRNSDEDSSVLDYSSLYPSSIISENLSHDTIDNNLNNRIDNIFDILTLYLSIIPSNNDSVDSNQNDGEDSGNSLTSQDIVINHEMDTDEDSNQARTLEHNQSRSPEYIDTSEEQSVPLCQICMNSRSCVVLIPCGHICCCQSCSQDSRIDRCPICRSEINRRQLVYYS